MVPHDAYWNDGDGRLRSAPWSIVDSKVAQERFYAKMGLKASDFFTDPKVLELCNALEVSDLEKIESLFKGGVDVNTRGKDNVAPLFWASPEVRSPGSEEPGDTRNRMLL